MDATSLLTNTASVGQIILARWDHHGIGGAVERAQLYGVQCSFLKVMKDATNPR